MSSIDKELWEPTLTRLFDQQLQPGSFLRIRDAWAIDGPNHGESASLNERLISSGFLLSEPPSPSVLMMTSRSLNVLPAYRDYARAIVAFLECGLLDGRYSTIVGIGHSAGSAPL